MHTKNTPTPTQQPDLLDVVLGLVDEIDRCGVKVSAELESIARAASDGLGNDRLTLRRNFGVQLRKAREQAGLTQAAAAKACGVAKRTWEHWEQSQRLPPAERDAITRERLLACLAKSASTINASKS